MPEERDDPRRHGDPLEDALRKTPARPPDPPKQPAGGGQTPTPGSAEGERDVDDQDR